MAARNSTRLTDRMIKAAQGPVNLADELAPGLWLRVQTAGGSKAFTVVYRLFGKYQRLSLGRYPALGLAEARNRAREALQLAGQGKDPRFEMTERAESPTMDELMDEFERIEGKKIRSIEERMRVLRKDLKQWKDRKVITVTRRNVVELVDEIAERGPGIARTFQGYLGRLLNFAAERGHIPVSPMAGLRRRVEDKPRKRVLTDEEIRLFWTKLDTSPIFPATRRALRMILITGQRPEEVVGMTWAETEGIVWTIPPERRKAGDKPHAVPLSDLALEVLCDCPRNKNHPFGSSHTDGHIRRDVLSRALLRYLPVWGIAPFTPHDLRRTMRTRLSALGVEEYIAERVIGHELQGMLRVYNQHEYLAEKMAAMDRWGEDLARIVGGDDEGGRHD